MNKVSVGAYLTLYVVDKTGRIVFSGYRHQSYARLAKAFDGALGT